MTKTERKRILIANPAKDMIHPILHFPGAKNYEFETAQTGFECWEKIQNFSPDLVLMDLLMPEMHGIETLKKIRSSQKLKKIGVIIASDLKMIQNYHAAVKGGADYYIKKPFVTELIFILFQRFFSGSLSPDPFSANEPIQPLLKEAPIYHPSKKPPGSYIKLWGTRGSVPVSGSEYVRCGGNTPCLEIRHKEHLIIIDAGTGIRPLGNSILHEDLKTVHLLIGHTHWDHIMGFPFFNPLYDKDFEIIIWAPVGFEKTAKELFTEMLAYSYFPVRLDDIQAKLVFKELRSQVPFMIGDVGIDAHHTFHPGETLSFKITIGDKTLGYVTDNEMLMGYHGDPNKIKKDNPLLIPYNSLINFYKDCDILFHEAQYTPEEYMKKVGWGHSSISNATVFIKYCKPKHWYVTHHDPNHSDEELQKTLHMHENILKDCGVNCLFSFAYDGLTIQI